MDSENEGSESGSDDNWQEVKSRKRRNEESPKIQRKRQTTINDPCTSTNMFQLLEQNSSDYHEKENNSEQKPPPIFLPNVSDIKKMITSFQKVISFKDFTYKSTNNGQVRLMIKSIDSYRNIVKYLDEKNIEFHTFQPKQERAYRAVVKNLHFSTPVEIIKEEIEKLGHKVRNIVNVKSRITKNPLSIFFVDLEPNDNNKEIFYVKFLYNAVVKIEPPTRNNDIVQCYRCQQFGHTKTYCRKLFRCVKCGLNHPSSQCTKNESAPPQCSNCLKAHTASYKGCEIYKELLKKKNFIGRHNRFDNNQETVLDINNNFPNLNNENKSSNNINIESSNQFSYSQAVKGSHQNENIFNSFRRIEALMEKQIETTTTLLNMMSTLIAKLCN